MDASVVKALKQWPNVPDCWGWLALDRRGHWLLRGEPVLHPGLIDFIGRNYLQLENGAYVFQNGPQRVHVALAYSPYVLRVSASTPGEMRSHNGLLVEEVSAAWLDESGALHLQTNFGAAVVDDRDLADLLECFELNDSAADENALVEAMESIMAGGRDVGMQFRWCQESVPVNPLSVDQIELALGFLRESPIRETEPTEQ